MKIPLIKPTVETIDEIIELIDNDFYSRYYKWYIRIKDRLVLLFGTEVSPQKAHVLKAGTPNGGTGKRWLLQW